MKYKKLNKKNIYKIFTLFLVTELQRVKPNKTTVSIFKIYLILNKTAQLKGKITIIHNVI